MKFCILKPGDFIPADDGPELCERLARARIGARHFVGMVAEKKRISAGPVEGRSNWRGSNRRARVQGEQRPSQCRQSFVEEDCFGICMRTLLSWKDLHRKNQVKSADHLAVANEYVPRFINIFAYLKEAISNVVVVKSFSLRVSERSARSPEGLGVDISIIPDGKHTLVSEA